MGDRTCKVPDCIKPSRSRGMCATHYENWRRYGHAVPVAQWSLVDRLRFVGWDVTQSGCWEWRGTRNEHGYGLITAKAHGSNDGRAHRAMVEVTRGVIPDGAVVRHKCDNPPCVNPDHLELGSQLDNMRDLAERGVRYLRGRTVCRNGHDISDPSSIKVINRRGGERLCIACEKARKARWEASRKAS